MYKAAVFAGLAVAAQASSEPVVIEGASFCSRWYHEGGHRGCSGPKDGATGVLFASEVASHDAPTLITQIGDEAAVILVTPSQLGGLQGDDDSFVKDVTSGADVRGIIVMDGGAVPTSFSPSASTVLGEGTPFEEMCLDSDLGIEWNSYGNGMIFTDIDIPIVSINDVTVQDDLIARAKANVDNYLGERQTAQIDAYFGGDGIRASDCLGWKTIEGDPEPQCTPIGGQSVKAHMGAHWGSDEMVFGMVGMDVQAMFPDQSYGAASVAPALAAFLAGADLLSQRDDLESLDHQIGFLAFQGESWGFLGSHRAVWDQKRTCEVTVSPDESPFGHEMCSDPMWPNTVFMDQDWSAGVGFIGIDQVGTSSDGKLYVHKSDQVDDWIHAVVVDDTPSSDLTVGVEPSHLWGMPPGVMSEYKLVYGQAGAALISGYDLQYSNRYYASRFDTADVAAVDTQVIADAATLFARSLYVAAGGSAAGALEISADVQLVDELYNCLAEDWDCDLMQGYIDQELDNKEDYLGVRIEKEVPSPPTFYAGAYSADNYRQPTVWREDGSVVALIEEEDERFDPETDKFVLVPSPLEIFMRQYLADKTARSTERFDACSVSSDCDMSARQECVQGQCITKNAFYQNAFSAGIRATPLPGVFESVDLDAPMAAEPIPGDLKLTIYPQAPEALSTATLVAGSVVATAAVYSVWKIAAMVIFV